MTCDFPAEICVTNWFRDEEILFGTHVIPPPGVEVLPYIPSPQENSSPFADKATEYLEPALILTIGTLAR